MTQSRLLLPILFVGACSVGEVNLGGDDTGGDGGTGTDDRNLCVNKQGTPATAYMHTGAPAGPRSGMGCIAVGCHLTGNTGAGASAFAFAGTVFKDTMGTAPQPGVTVRIFPGTGNTMRSIASAVTDSAGNFIIRGNYTAFPYATDVTGCGSDAVAMGIRPMTSPIARNDNNCNAGGTCHVSPGAATPIYLLD